MSGREIAGRYLGLAILLLTSVVSAQEKPSVPSASDTLEFPVVMQQKIAAGITPVGTKVQAKLTIATLVHGTVIPRDAVFSGEVTESTAKSSSAPSRLGVRMDSAQWRNGSAPVKVYLTAWYYPTRAAFTEDGSSGPSDIHGEVAITFGGAIPSPSTPNGGHGASSDDGSLIPPNIGTEPPSSMISDHRVLMKDVESTRGNDGVIALSCKRSSLKLDKVTTYVLASGDLLPQHQH
jgi:hypothetical protein